MNPTLGRIVLYCLEADDLPHARAGEERPAIVVRENGLEPNLAVLLDGPNDKTRDPLSTTLWCGTVPMGADPTSPNPGTWRWPPRS